MLGKQMTIRAVPPSLEQALRQEAQRRGKSVNKTVLDLLSKATGLGKPSGGPPYTDLDHLLGRWSKEEAEEFDRALAETRQIDPELWR